MPRIIDTPKQTEWKFADALMKFLPLNLEWLPDTIGYPALYQKGFLGFFKGEIADLTSNTVVTIKCAEWRNVILEALLKYEAEKGVTIEVQFDF